MLGGLSWSSEPTEATIINVFGVVLNADCLPSSSWIWLVRSLDPSMRQKGVGLLMIMARAFYRFQYMLRHHPTEIRSILTLQKRHCKGVSFCISFFGWTLDETNARAAVQKRRGSWVRSKIFKLTKGSDFGISLLRLHSFVWQTAMALLKQEVWTRLLCCLAYLGKTEVASSLQEWEEDPPSCFHMSL